MIKDIAYYLSILFMLGVIVIYGFYLPNLPIENCTNFLCIGGINVTTY